MTLPLAVWERLAFVGNGCSAGFLSDQLNGIGGGLGRTCCDTHDWHYHFADIARHTADVALSVCISSSSGFWGAVALVGVSLFGWLFYEYGRRRLPSGGHRAASNR